MSVTPIVEDKRAIGSIAFGPAGDDFGYSVGIIGVTEIRAYYENGEMAPVAWFAIFIGTEMIARVPARMVFITYQPPGGMQ